MILNVILANILVLYTNIYYNRLCYPQNRELTKAHMHVIRQYTRIALCENLETQISLTLIMASRNATTRWNVHV